jgi:hypothetical protein
MSTWSPRQDAGPLSVEYSLESTKTSEYLASTASQWMPMPSSIPVSQVDRAFNRSGFISYGYANFSNEACLPRRLTTQCWLQPRTRHSTYGWSHLLHWARSPSLTSKRQLALRRTKQPFEHGHHKCGTYGHHTAPISGLGRVRISPCKLRSSGPGRTTDTCARITTTEAAWTIRRSRMPPPKPGGCSSRGEVKRSLFSGGAMRVRFFHESLVSIAPVGSSQWRKPQETSSVVMNTRNNARPGAGSLISMQASDR